MQSGRLVANTYQRIVQQKIPITEKMGWQIQELQEWHIRTQSPLDANINIHQTVFAGSIYSLAMATGWTLVYFWLQQNQFKNQLVAANAEINYQQPLTTNIYCKSELKNHSSLYKSLKARNQQHKGMKIPLEVQIESDVDICAILKIHFVATKLT